VRIYRIERPRENFQQHRLIGVVLKRNAVIYVQFGPGNLYCDVSLSRFSVQGKICVTVVADSVLFELHSPSRNVVIDVSEWRSQCRVLDGTRCLGLELLVRCDQVGTNNVPMNEMIS
jgi:hypothetical protein